MVEIWAATGRTIFCGKIWHGIQYDFESPIKKHFTQINSAV